MSHRRTAIASAVALLTASAVAFAAPAGNPGQGAKHGRMFGRGAPFSVSDLPAGKLRRDLESRSAQARGKALGWLHEFEFPDTDTDTLRVDKDGGVFYEDAIELPTEPQEAPAPVAESSDTPIAAVENPFALHSRRGALGTVYLDFTGHTITKTAWNASTGVDPLVAQPFDLDGSPSTVGTAEKAAIAEIWHRVAEDYAAFDIDVTTEEPASFGPTVGRVLITRSTDANGKAMPSSTAGGVAYVGVFGSSSYASYYSPALIYFNNLANGTTYIAEACAHEFGHNLGLSHDGTSSASYYAGHGSGFTSWAPIMGNSYYNNVTEWSKGEYSGANNTQDDIALIAAKLGFVADDHGNTPAAATALAVSTGGSVAVSNPQTDADDLYPQNKGVIGQRGDKDVFSLKAGAGALTLTVNPAWDAFYRTDKRGANLDLRAVLTDSQGNQVAVSDPASDTYATVSATVAAGVYYLEVSAVGSANYSDYASQGQYFVSGQVAPSTAANQAPAAAFGFACSGTSCTFSDSSTDTDGQIASRAWNFGDGSSATGASVTHAYGANGTYSVGLAVTDDAGASASTTQAVTVAAVNAAPKAAFTLSCSGLSCSFSDGSSDSDGSLTAWSWNFGDGSSSTERNPSHAYAAAGTYSVTLTVTDNVGASANATGSATPTAPANAAPSASFTAKCSGKTCTFADASKDSDGTVTGWLWSFGDGSTSTLKNPTRTYAAKGNYTVTLKATDNAGATASISKKVSVR